VAPRGVAPARARAGLRTTLVGGRVGGGQAPGRGWCRDPDGGLGRLIELPSAARGGSRRGTRLAIDRQTVARFGINVRDVEAMRFQAMVQNDLKSLDPLLAENLVYMHTDGTVESKSEFLERLRSGSLRYRSIAPTDVRVRTFGNTAVITGRSQMAVTNAGADHEFEILYTAVYEAAADRWQLVSWQSTRLQR